MPLSESRKRANAKWNKENLDRIQLVARKGLKEKIVKVASEHGDSLNHYILESVLMRMESENKS